MKKIRKIKLTNYSYIHQWNNENYPKSGKCHTCGVEGKRTEWALIHGKEHNRGIDNYMELCKKCHIAYDRTDIWIAKNKFALSQTYNHLNPVKDKVCEHCLNLFKPRRKTTRFCSTKCSARGTPRQIRERDFVNGRWLELNKK